MSRRKTIEEKFWRKVNKNGPIVRTELGPCHIWTGALDPQGYGQTNATGTTKRAHRVAWELVKREPPPEVGLCHHCDIHACVNTDHMFPGTQLENMRDCVRKQRQARGERQGNAKFTESTIRLALEMKSNGQTLTEVATSLGISRSHCCSILKGKYWKHVVIQ